MNNTTTVKLPSTPADQMKVLNQLIQQARADKKTQPVPAKEEAVKVTIRIKKSLKDRLVKACGSQSQNEVIASLIEKFCRQSEKTVPAKAQELPAVDELPVEDIESANEVEDEPLMDFTQFMDHKI